MNGALARSPVARRPDVVITPWAVATRGSGRPSRLRTRDPWAVEQRNGRMGCVMQPWSHSKAPPEALVSLASGPPGARRRAHRPLLPPHRQIARHDRQAADRRGPRPWGHRQRDRRRRLPARSGLSAECGLESGHTGPRPRYILKRWARPAGYTPPPATRQCRNGTGLCSTVRKL